MTDREKVIEGLECCVNDKPFYHAHCDDCPYNGCNPDNLGGCTKLYRDALELLKEQEPHELTKEEWEKWKKDERRDPICMIWYGDTTPFWVLRPESIHEPLYLVGGIKLFTKKPMKEQVKWDG